jgi:Peptidase S24-like
MTRNEEARRTLWFELAAELLRSFGELRLAVVGSSMVPSIFSGDKLTIRRAQANEIQTGHVVVYFRDGRLIVHRVIRTKRSSAGLRWITRGDASTREDSAVEETELLGRVTLIERNGRRWRPPHPSMFRQLLQWAVRHSLNIRRLALWWHSLRGRLGRRVFPVAVFDARGCS